MQTEKSSYDERSKTNSTIKSSCGNWTNGSVRGSVHEVTHRCETFHKIVVFFCSHYCAERGNCSLAHTVVHVADMTISAVQNVYDATKILSVD